MIIDPRPPATEEAGRANHGCSIWAYEKPTPFPIATCLMVLIAIAILLPAVVALVIRWL